MSPGAGHRNGHGRANTIHAYSFEQQPRLYRINDKPFNTCDSRRNIFMERSERIYICPSKPYHIQRYGCNGRNIFSYRYRSRMHQRGRNNNGSRELYSIYTDSGEQRTCVHRTNTQPYCEYSSRRNIFLDGS